MKILLVAALFIPAFIPAIAWYVICVRRFLRQQALAERKQKWIEEVYTLLCASQRPEDDNEKRNLHKWAELMAEDENCYFNEGATPKEAHWEELHGRG